MAGLDEGQLQWLDEGLAGMAATVGEEHRTTLVRVFAHRASADGAHVDFYIALSDAERTLHNLEQHPQAALNLVSPRTYRSLTFKGPCAPVDEPCDEALLDACLRRAGAALEQVGMPADIAPQMLSHYGDRAMLGLRLRVEEVFDQSPGPHAGAKL